MRSLSPLARVGPALGLALLLAACPGAGAKSPLVGASASIIVPSSHVAPPIPDASGQTVGPDQPPLIWVGGELTDVTEDRLVLRERLGSVLRLTRLARDATSFFHVAGDAWQRLGPGAPVAPGQAACVEALMDGTTLLALRVFLGSECGPV